MAQLTKMSTARICLISLFLLMSGCNRNEDDPPEAINKLRALGVSASKLTTAPAASGVETVNLTFYAAMPKGTKVTATPFKDDGPNFTVPVELTLIPGTEVYDTQYAALDIFQVQAALTIPSAAVLTIPPGKKFVTLRYGLEFDDGSENERIVGSYPVYAEGSPELLEWKPLSVDVLKPTLGEVLGQDDEQSLEATISKETDENVRVGWFVSDGRIKNRRAKETIWQTPDSNGKALVIATARGLRTGSFAIKPVEVTIE